MAFVFFRTFASCCLRPALLRALPVYTICLVLGGAVREAVPLHTALGRSSLAVPLVATLWTLTISRTHASLFGAQATEYLRYLPIPTPLVRAALLGSLVLIDLPWVFLCVASGEPNVILAGPALSLALHVSFGAGERHRLAVLALLVVAPLVPLWLIPVPALLIAWAAAPWAWTVVRAGCVAAWDRFPVRVPWIGIARTLIEVVVFGDAQLMRRIIGVLAVVSAVASLAIVNNSFVAAEMVMRSCSIALLLALPFVLIRVSSGILENGWMLDWIFACTGTSRLSRAVGGLAAVTGLGATLGATQAVAVLVVVRPSAGWTLVLVQSLGGAVLAVLAMGMACAAARFRAIDQIRLIALQVPTVGLLAFLVGSGNLRNVVFFVAPPALGALGLYFWRVVPPRTV